MQRGRETVEGVKEMTCIMTVVCQSCLNKISYIGWLKEIWRLKFQIEMLAELLSSEASLQLAGDHSSPAAWPHARFSMQGHLLCLLCAQILSSHKDSSHIELESTHMSSFNLNHLFKGLFFTCSHIIRYWGLGLLRMNWGWGSTHDSAHNNCGDS